MRVIEPPASLVEQLRARYSEAHRVYHSWAHIEALLALFEAQKGLLRDPTRVLWALYWHDAVFDPAREDNEASSAALLREQAAPYLPEARIFQAERLILATVRHETPPGLGFDVAADCAAFLDFDLSFLAAPEEEFDAYEAGIRQEYAFLPQEIFAPARAQTLQRLLLREKLYQSPLLARLWDGQARANLRRAIARLSSGIVTG